MRLRLLFVPLLLLLTTVGGVRAFAQDCPGDSTSTSCTGGDGNGGSGANGGQGGVGKDDGDPPTAPPTAPPPPAQPVAPRSDTGGGTAATTAPARSGPTGGTSSDRGGTASNDAELLQWAQHFHTTPDEVKSWFVAAGPNDTIGGEGSGLVVHPGDEMTVSNNGAVKDGAAAAAYMDFREGATVDISMHSARVPLTTATTDSSGVFTSSVKIPDNASLGNHFIVALTLNTKGGKIAFVFPIKVVTPEPVFNAPAAPTATHHSNRSLYIELLAGTALIAGLVVFRVRRAAAQ